MKKVLILQLLGKSYGGVWQVNKLIGEALLKENFNVTILNLRDNKNDFDIEHNKKLKVDTINKLDNWDYPLKSDVLKFKISIFDYLKKISRIKHDYKKMKSYINDYSPDYIIVSHYLLLNAVHDELLAKTIYVHHSSAQYAFSQKGNRRTLFKFNNKIKFVWLSKTSCEYAIKNGLNNCYYIYNAVRFNTDKRADVVKNKKLVTITRISYEKRIDLMIKIVNELFKEYNELNDWVLEIYGSGGIEKSLKSLDYNKDRIKFVGVTDNPKEVLLNSSINLNTSLFEGFSLSILEANECGIPTIAFNFGESAEEEILNNKTGIIASDVDDYKEKLLFLMKNSSDLEKMSLECKKFNSNFKIEKIIKDWLAMFKIIDNE